MAGDALTEAEKGSLGPLLNDKYGLPWCLRALDLELLPQEQVCVNTTVKDPTQIFLLTLPDNVQPLLQVVRTHFCQIDLMFVGS